MDKAKRSVAEATARLQSVREKCDIRPSAEPPPLEQKEKPLGAVFLAAIYDDLDDLYET